MSLHPHDIDELIGKYLAGEASTEETKRVQDWCALSVSNQQYYNHLQTIFSKASLSSDYSLYDTDVAWQKVKGQLHDKKTQQLFGTHFLRIAASLLLISVIGLLVYLQFIGNVSEMELTSTTTVTTDSLLDGTYVALNKYTAMHVEHNAARRKTNIKIKGEALFSMKHDSSKEECIVHADETLIRDIGTVFNVKSLPESRTVEVIVQEGEVHFYTQNNQGIFIKAGHKGIYDKHSKSFVSEQANINEVAYATKQFVFQESDLQQVTEQLNAIYTKKIKIGDNLKNCKVTVNFNNENIDTIAEILAETLNLRITNTANEIILQGDACD